MFGKKQDKKDGKNKYNGMETIVIPAVFYGGQDPYIYHNHNVVENNLQSKSKVINNKDLKKQKKGIVKIQNKKKSTKKIWIFAVIGLLVAIGIITWYYINQYNKANAQLADQNNNQVISPVIIKDTTEQNKSTPVDVVTSTVELATSTVSLQNIFLEFPPILTLDGADVDADSLTDLEEAIFGTDSGTWDSDDDKYYDGQEVYNLYNPKGQAPVKLVDSGLVLEYKNFYSGYRIYYPSVWQRGSVDVSETQVLFSASNGDYIEVRVFTKEAGQTFVNWFSRYAEGQNYTDLVSFKNRFAENAMIRKDNLVAYFEDANYIYTIIYHTKDRGPILYRHVMQMMYQSFRMSNTNTVLPDQVVYPGLDSTSTANVVVPSLENSSSTTGNNN